MYTDYRHTQSMRELKQRHCIHLVVGLYLSSLGILLKLWNGPCSGDWRQHKQREIDLMAYSAFSCPIHTRMYVVFVRSCLCLFGNFIIGCCRRRCCFNDDINNNNLMAYDISNLCPHIFFHVCLICCVLGWCVCVAAIVLNENGWICASEAISSKSTFYHMRGVLLEEMILGGLLRMSERETFRATTLRRFLFFVCEAVNVRIWFWQFSNIIFVQTEWKPRFLCAAINTVTASSNTDICWISTMIYVSPANDEEETEAETGNVSHSYVCRRHFKWRIGNLWLFTVISGDKKKNPKSGGEYEWI